MGLSNCKVCGEITKTIKCEYRGHDNKCSVCGKCPDCDEYKEKVRRYREMVNDPEYFHEPFDWSDTPASREPKPPKKRIDSFPGKNEILEITEPTPVKDLDGVLYIEITFQVETYIPVACASGLVGQDKVKEIFYYSPERRQVFCLHSKFWGWVHSNYTEQAIYDFMEKLKNIFEGNDMDFLKDTSI